MKRQHYLALGRHNSPCILGSNCMKLNLLDCIECNNTFGKLNTFEQTWSVHITFHWVENISWLRGNEIGACGTDSTKAKNLLLQPHRKQIPHFTSVLYHHRVSSSALQSKKSVPENDFSTKQSSRTSTLDLSLNSPTLIFCIVSTPLSPLSMCNISKFFQIYKYL